MRKNKKKLGYSQYENLLANAHQKLDFLAEKFQELQTFFNYLGDGKYNNKWSDYAISVVTSKEDIIVTIVISLIGVASVILITKIIMQWI